MLRKKNFFKNFSSNFKQLNNNLKKTKKIYKEIEKDINNSKIPFLQSYKKKYNFSFSKQTVKKFSKYNNIIILGMGGSVLGAKAIHSYLAEKIKKKIFFFDNLDQNLSLKFEQVQNLKNSCFIVVSKSGNTLETIANFCINLSNLSLKNKIVFITEIKDNSLISLAKKYNAQIIEHKNFIGGRYSVLSEVGMFPAALMGLKIENFQNLQKFMKSKNFINSLIYNVACIYTLNTNGIKNSVLLNYSSRLENLCDWYKQLVAESLGKNGKGITPIISPCPKDHHSILQLFLDGPKDKFFTFINSTEKNIKCKIKISSIPKNMKFLKNKSIESIVKAQFKATTNIFTSKKIPFRQITFNKKNEEELGMIFTFFVLETILLARLMKINPYDQPAVEQVKKETLKFL